jgi:hypothetical protein
MHKLTLHVHNEYVGVYVRDCHRGPANRMLAGCYLFPDHFEPMFERCIYECCGPEEYILAAEMVYTHFHEPEKRKRG